MCIRDRCNKVYIGQTERSFKQRYFEHINALHFTTESTFTNHLIEADYTYTNINITWKSYTNTKGCKLDALEQPEIYKHIKTHRNNILNEQT